MMQVQSVDLWSRTRRAHTVNWGAVWRHVFLAGHVAAYAGVLATAGFQSEEYRYIGFVGTAVQVLAGIPAVAWSRTLRVRMLILGVLLYAMGLAGYGLWLNNFPSYWAIDVLAFGLLTGVFLGAQPGIAEALAKLYAWLMLGGVPLAVYLSMQLHASSAEQRLGGDLETNAFYIPVLCSPALFIVLWPGIRARWMSVVSIAAVLVTIGFGIITLTRGAIVTPLVALGLRLLMGANKRGTAVGVIALGAMAVAGALSVWSAEQLGRSVDGVKGRFSDTEEFTSGRDREGAYFLDVLSSDEVVVGRGMGGSYHGLIPANEQYGINMVHFGPLHLMLKGGVVLAGVIGLLCGAAMLHGYRSALPVQRAAAAFVALFSLMNLMYTQFLPQPTMALFAVAVGVALARQTNPRVAGPKVSR